ncbi:hypothetical protein ACOQFV_27920 [Nocardiopsis changdeensis]|uniref:WXG100 family type VII secretion target n=1 Tax=Nocardiopsis changdeensis TaxID=2831969 RepID=A0ABX8BEW7_9ACTN|nr:MULTISPECIES: hypothetical protein [Nocardiopsis]QUX20792.1 hypothetical protein KGD84_20185 [Nocardiopsis changdeensis]QYX36724.1 hypothetical protein K1J57_29640 [Nocardiopsis sp. MT53]
MSDDHLTVLPEDMARAGEDLREPGRLVREAFARLRTARQSLGAVWGSGDDISESLTKNLTPMIETLDEYGEALPTAFDQAADRTLQMARNYEVSEDYAFDVSSDLGSGSGYGGGGGGRNG